MVNILFSVDERGYEGLFATINSIISHKKKQKEKYNFFILGTNDYNFYLEIMNENPYDKFYIENFYDVKYNNQRQILFNLLKKQNYKTDNIAHNNMMNYARIFLPEIFKGVNKGVYLDNDLIIKKDIKELFEMDLGEKLVAAPLTRDLDKHMGFPNSIPELKMEINKKYKGFNAGVYLYSLEKWRANEMTKQAVEILHFNTYIRKIMRHGTQPLMNLLFNGRMKAIDKRWNLTGLGWRKKIEEYNLDGAYILHWSGPKKPWLEQGLYKEYWVIHNRKFQVPIVYTAKNHSFYEQV
jgi:lipopolysaccharide biosynthesis glycosyltransferase